METEKEKINVLIQYLANQMYSYTVEFNENTLTFKFSQAGKRTNLTKHVLRISEELLEDFTSREIIQKLTTLKWENKLQRAGKRCVLLPRNSIRINK